MNANETNNGPDTNLTKAENALLIPTTTPTLIHYILPSHLPCRLSFIFRGIMACLILSLAVPFTDELTILLSPVSHRTVRLFSNCMDLNVRYSILTTWMRYYLILPFRSSSPHSSEGISHLLSSIASCTNYCPIFPATHLLERHSALSSFNSSSSPPKSFISTHSSWGLMFSSSLSSSF